MNIAEPILLNYDRIIPASRLGPLLRSGPAASTGGSCGASDSGSGSQARQGAGQYAQVGYGAAQRAGIAARAGAAADGSFACISRCCEYGVTQYPRLRPSAASTRVDATLRPGLRVGQIVRPLETVAAYFPAAFIRCLPR
jgi:hypothetical protein